MSDAERGDAGNLIYLCGDHHDAIDTQLEKHTVAFLRDAKQRHERAMNRAGGYAVGSVGFAHLQTVCQYLAVTVSGDLFSNPELPVTVEEKLSINSLSDRVAERVRIGSSLTSQVGHFITFASQTSPDFGRRLAAYFKAQYESLIAAGIVADDVFELLEIEAIANAGAVESPELNAAALAVVVHFFEICEVFEREPAAA